MAENKPHEHYDIAIIGGGLVGATFALSLSSLIQRFGLKVLVIEASDIGQSAPAYQPSFDERSSALAYGSRLHFERLGIWYSDGELPGIEEQAAPIQHVHVAERGRLGAVRLNAAEMNTEALGYVAPNAWMGNVLVQHVRNLSIEWRAPVRVESILPQEGGYLMQLSDGSHVRADLTVLADGGRSPLKGLLGIENSVHDYQQNALISTVEVSRPHRGVAYERFDPEGPMALLPLQGNRMALIWTLVPDRMAELQQLDDTNFLREVQAFFGDRLGRFMRVGERHSYPLKLVQAEEQVRPHLAILGNAAHTMHPVAGQGFNLALRGLMDLRETLEKALETGVPVGAAETMNAFEARRRRDRDGMVQASHRLVELFGVENPLFSHARAAGLIGLNLVAPLRRALTRRAMGIER